MLVKGTNLFVFLREDSSSPKYAIELAHKTVTLHPISGHSQIVTIENGLGDIEYKFRFELRENSDLAKNFSNVLKEKIAISDTNEIKDVSDFVLYCHTQWLFFIFERNAD